MTESKIDQKRRCSRRPKPCYNGMVRKLVLVDGAWADIRGYPRLGV